MITSKYSEVIGINIVFDLFEKFYHNVEQAIALCKSVDIIVIPKIIKNLEYLDYDISYLKFEVVKSYIDMVIRKISNQNKTINCLQLYPNEEYKNQNSTLI